ncbi:Asx homology domain-containing protein [Diaporthe sp. PMI_573]|nr:Asx homology domain-containing protein [Diaporthaceae sp. PMI_573]
MAPRTRSLSGSKDNVSSNGQAESNGDSTLSHKQPVNDEPTTKKEENDEVLEEIQVARRSSRRRVPSKRTQVTFAEPASSAAPASKRPKTSAKKWTPEYVTQSKQSPLVGKNLRALLLHPQAWDVLSDEDKKELLDLFPDTTHILNPNTPEARPNVMSLQNDDNFRHDTEQYVKNLKASMHDPAWLQDAWAAHEARAAGQFDEYYIQKLEVDWRTTIPDEMKPEHLRSSPPAEPNNDVENEPQAEHSSSADQLAKGMKSPNDAQARTIQVSTGDNEAINPEKVNGSGVVESDTKANSDEDVQDVVMALSTDGSTKSVPEDLQKVSVANIHETVEENPAKTTTAPAAD